MSKFKKQRIFDAARSVFLQYGFRRVSMNDIAEAAGVSRPALYVLFRNKEEIFLGVMQRWIDETLAAIDEEIATPKTAEKKLERAFELWSVRPFEMTLAAPEARELVECGFDFAQAPLKRGYDRFEAAIVPLVQALVETHAPRHRMPARRIAHVLSSAVRGYKQNVDSPADLRAFVRDLLRLSVHPPASKAPIVTRARKSPPAGSG